MSGSTGPVLFEQVSKEELPSKVLRPLRGPRAPCASLSHTGNLNSAIVELFTPRKFTNTTNQGSLSLKELVVNTYQNAIG